MYSFLYILRQFLYCFLFPLAFIRAQPGWSGSSPCSGVHGSTYSPGDSHSNYTRHFPPESPSSRRQCNCHTTNQQKGTLCGFSPAFSPHTFTGMSLIIIPDKQTPSIWWTGGHILGGWGRWRHLLTTTLVLQAPQRVIRDKNLSVISSLSILENSQSKGGGTEDCSQPSLLEPAGDGGSPTVLTNNYKPSVLVDAQQQTMHSTGHVMSFPSHVPTTATPSISHVSTTTTNHVSTATPPIGHVSTIANHVPTATPPIGHMPTATPPTCHLPPAITPISHLPPTTLPTSHVPAATPPTGHVISPSIHMTLENHQRQLETLQDEVSSTL